MSKFDYYLNKGLSYVWLGLCVIAVCSALFWGATHQLLTAGISFVMYLAMKPDKSEIKED